MARTVNILSLCSGTGGLELGVSAAIEHLGGRPRVVGYVERDAYASSVLLARMEDKALEPAPVWCGDLADMDAESLRGHVDLICAGFPCQPWSHAGKQQGTADARWLWPALFRIGLVVRPKLWFLENVPGLVSGGGLELVLSDLAKGGWDAEWCHIAAAAVGASHKRERVFILAHAGLQHGDLQQRRARPEHPRNGDSMADAASLNGGLGRHGANGAGEAGAGNVGRHGPTADDRPEVADAPRGGLGIVRQPPGGNGQPHDGLVGDTEHGPPGNGAAGRLALADALRGRSKRRGIAGELVGAARGAEGQGNERQRGGLAAGGGNRSVGDSELRGEEGADAQLADADGRVIGESSGQERTGGGNGGGDSGFLFAPGPSDPRWPEILAAHPHLAPAVESGLCVSLDGSPFLVDASRADQLRCGGNGVVPLQAAVAFVELVRRIRKERSRVKP